MLSDINCFASWGSAQLIVLHHLTVCWRSTAGKTRQQSSNAVGRPPSSELVYLSALPISQFRRLLLGIFSSRASQRRQRFLSGWTSWRVKSIRGTARALFPRRNTYPASCFLFFLLPGWKPRYSCLIKRKSPHADFLLAIRPIYDIPSIPVTSLPSYCFLCRRSWRWYAASAPFPVTGWRRLPLAAEV